MGRISAEEFVAWMITQPNRNGKPYLERVMRHYIRCMRSVPSKLFITLQNSERDIFACTNLEDFDRLYQAFVSAPNFLKVNYANSHNSFSAGMNCYRRYLEYLSNEAKGTNKAKVETAGKEKELDAIITYKKKSPDVPISVDFSNLAVGSKTRPDKCVIIGKTIRAQSWPQMYVCVVERLLITRYRPIAFIKLKTKDGVSQPLIMDTPLAGFTCAKLSNGQYINISYSVSQIVQMIGMLCAACGIKKENIELTYWKNNADVKRPSGLEKTAEHNQEARFHNVELKTADAIDLVLTEKFTNGFRLGSFIETERLRKFINGLLTAPSTLSDAEIESYVKTRGIVFDGKIYSISADTKAKIKALAHEHFQSGACAIFYDAFYAKHEAWLMAASVVSKDMLEPILKEEFPWMWFDAGYFRNTLDEDFTIIESEVLRVWGSGVLLTCEILAQRLGYIPFMQIKQVLAQSKYFIPNGALEYAYIAKLIITEDDKKKITSFAASETEKHGYASFANFPLDDFSERNYELRQSAVHAAVFRLCLEGDYEQRGKIITRKCVDIDARRIMNGYCRSLERCTLEELLEYEKALTGESLRALQAGYDVMVRIDKDNFIADKYLDFDSSAIDNAIELFMNGGVYVPLRHVTTFAPFPHCGQAWTLFLLESYCRRFSEHFRFDALSVNSSNTGVIVRKTSRLAYRDIMADAVARSEVALNTSAVLNYLAENGYISQRRYTKVDELIKKANALRGCSN